jgi:hypothetical protein
MYMLETVQESSDSALQEAAIFAEYGVKTKDLRSLEKARNCGLFDSICPELRAKSPQGLKEFHSFVMPKCFLARF